MQSPEQLFNENQNLVYYAIKKIKCPAAWYEDCLQEGMLGLWYAATNYDPNLGYKFSTYAVPSIMGHMKRFCRDVPSTIKIPRIVWDENKPIELEFLPLDKEISEDSDHTFHEIIPGVSDFYPNLFEDQLEDFLETIPEGRYRNIAEEYLYGCCYGDCPKQTELAEKYNCSQPHIARYLKRIRNEFSDFLYKE